jgi:murein L,D-transpeptidase YafK
VTVTIFKIGKAIPPNLPKNKIALKGLDVLIPRSLFFWTVSIEAAVLIILLGTLAYDRFVSGTAAPPSPADVGQSEGALRIPALVEPVIVIDKSDMVLILYDGQREVIRFPAALGKRSGDKVHEGDCKTPEGAFYVCLKNPQSKFVLSLGLSYPNADHARRGLRDGLITQQEYDRIISALRQGRKPPWNTALGGEIMIHGCRDGERGTRGCIAIENDVIKELFPRIPVGTPVIIKE